MDLPDLKLLEDLLTADAERVIREFAHSPDNKGIYAFVLEYGALNNELYLKWNDLESFRQAVPADATDVEIYGIDGLKYNTGDFVHVHDASETTYDVLRQYYKPVTSLPHDAQTPFFRRLLESMAAVITRLGPTFELFDREKDFIAYVEDWQCAYGSAECGLPLMRRTIPDETMFKLFRGYEEAERIMHGVAGRSEDEQTRFWIEELRADYVGRETPLSAALIQHGRPRYAMAAHQLLALGASALPLLIDEARDCFDGRSDTHEVLVTSPERFVVFAADVVEGIASICSRQKLTASAFVADVKRWLKQWHSKERGTRGRFNVMFDLASALHRLVPEQYPKPKRTDDWLELENASEFGL